MFSFRVFQGETTPIAAFSLALKVSVFISTILHIEPQLVKVKLIAVNMKYKMPATSICIIPLTT